MIDETLAWRVEETCFNAWPSLRQVLVGGWIARFAPGVSRRANSVNLLRPDYGEIERKIDLFERLVRGQGAVPVFRVLSFLDPSLDAALVRRGYSLEGETLTLVNPEPPQAGRVPGVRVTPRPDRAWLEACSRFQGRTPDQAETYDQIVGALAVPSGFAAALTPDGEIAAVGYAVVHEGLWCVESVVTAPAHRSRGHARRMLAGLADWAAGQGASSGCLQVQADNPHAERLYGTSGFVRELYRYRYRRAPA